jgi:hypothetical protein
VRGVYYFKNRGPNFLLRADMKRAILTTMILVFLSSVSFAADWKYYYTNSKGTDSFYDAQSIIREGNTIRVWGKLMLSDKDKVNYIKDHPKIYRIEKINYTIGRWEVDCLKYNFRVLFSNWYGSDGNIIYSMGSPGSQFREVVPGSNIAKLVAIICKEGEGGK